jgi:hypothetical protein
MFSQGEVHPEGVFDKLKARLVAGGHLKDRQSYTNESVESPTASTTSMFITAGIAAVEERTIATVDFPGAYLHADLPEDGPKVYMRLNK